MRNQRTLQAQGIRADKRFDALVKKEMQEYQHLISSHNKEMQSLRDALRLAQEKIEALFLKNDKELSDLKDRAETHILILKERIAEHSLTIADQKKTIDSLHEQLNSFHESRPSKADMEKLKKDIEDRLTDTTMTNIVSFQDAHREFKDLFSSLKDNFVKVQNNLGKEIFDAIEKGEANFHLARLDKEGIERELIRYKKEVFYIEKKIENLYTLIERINKRGELCRKPE